MWQDTDTEDQTDGPPNNGEHPPSCTETLKTLAEVNEQCLELLAEQALVRTLQAPPIFRELTDLWTQLDVSSRRRAAACPYLLVDVGFSDPYRWRWAGTSRVGDCEPVNHTDFFTVAGASKVAHQVFTNAWYIARTQPIGTPLFLGMPAHCAALLRACTMRQVTELAHQHAGWLRPRWAGRVRIWRELLVAAISGESVALDMARLHGVQLLAVELKALEQVTAKEPRSS
jgi:hypothetical protein